MRVILSVILALAWAGNGYAGEEIAVELPGGSTMEFVWIDSGKFMLGSPLPEEGRLLDEGPQHQVTIGEGFYLGKYEVTQEQWLAVMEEAPWAEQNGVEEDAKRPAVDVSWADAQSFVHRLNEAAGDSLYRLPTEAEWEYACRAGTTTRWSFGDAESELGEYAWCSAGADEVVVEEEKRARQVGLKKPNPWGLYDMHGNVWEWCQDWYGEFTSEGKTDPVGPEEGKTRVIRGGNFGNKPRSTRSAYRYHYAPDSHYLGIGLRLVKIR